MTEDTIQFAMWCELLSRNHKVVVPNVSWAWLSWEADLISATQANYWNEYEIKCTKADFVNDFRKRKHYALTHANTYNNHTPNYFWYVAPIEAIPLCIPDYAGLIVVKETDDVHNYIGLEVEYAKKATMLHKNKLSPDGQISILRSAMFKYWCQRKVYYDNRRNQGGDRAASNV